MSRDLDLRFIDARDIAAEARIVLGIQGYPSKDQAPLILDEAIRIFHSKSDKEQHHLRQMNWELEAIKLSAGSQSSSDWIDSSDRNSITSDVVRSNTRRGIMGIFRR